MVRSITHGAEISRMHDADNFPHGAENFPHGAENFPHGAEPVLRYGASSA